MTSIDPQTSRRFAVDVVEKLRSAGFEALWAGGCVRDQLLGVEPKDYDVATSATPQQVRKVFGRGRTLAIGEAFGVIVVLGPPRAGQIEIATFRCDAQYSDGRHPDSVTFSTAEEDAQRRDFTINALFFDPTTEQVVDYVNGVEDLNRQVVRAVGDPFQRIAEDKLRMLRAVRFTSTFDFTLDENTLAAVQQQSHEIVIVSAERVAEEMRRMLVHANRVRSVELLNDSGLLEVVLPEVSQLDPQQEGVVGSASDNPWHRTLAVLGSLQQSTFPMALAAILREIDQGDTQSATVERICRRWKLSRHEMDCAIYLLEHQSLIRIADSAAWPKLQRLLVTDGIDDLLALSEAVAKIVDGHVEAIDYCRQRLALPAEQLNPVPLIDGGDLKAEGIVPGPVYKQLLGAVRDAQLENRITTKAEALEMVQDLLG